MWALCDLVCLVAYQNYIEALYHAILQWKLIKEHPMNTFQMRHHTLPYRVDDGRGPLSLARQVTRSCGLIEVTLPLVKVVSMLME